MDETRFWAILKAASDRVTENPDWFGKDMKERLREELEKLSGDEIMRFRQLFAQKVDAAYSIDMWGAAYTINGGCSDDGFHYFRNWLVGTGPVVYANALANPDSLADILTGDWPMEATLDGAACPAWEKVTGQPHMEFFQVYEKLERLPTPDRDDEDWDFDDDDEVRRRFPRLSALYLTESEE